MNVQVQVLSWVQNYNMLSKKQLANPFGLDVKNIYREPKIGDKIIIKNYSRIPSNEAVKLSKLKYLTVEDVIPIVIGEENNYIWHYEVYIKEYNINLLQGDYSFVD